MRVRVVDSDSKGQTLQNAREHEDMELERRGLNVATMMMMGRLVWYGPVWYEAVGVTWSSLLVDSTLASTESDSESVGEGV